MPSTGPMPKCSLVGVYSKANVDGAERSADRCAVVKFNRNRMSGLLGVHSNRGMLMLDDEGEIMLNDSKFVFAPAMSEVRVLILSSSLGS